MAAGQADINSADKESDCNKYTMDLFPNEQNFDLDKDFITA